jgi:signal peptidase I
MADDNNQSCPPQAGTDVSGTAPDDTRAATPAPAAPSGARPALVFVGIVLGLCLAAYFLLGRLLRLEGGLVGLRAVLVGMFGVSLTVSALLLWLTCRLMLPFWAKPPAAPRRVGLVRALAVALAVGLAYTGLTAALLIVGPQALALVPVDLTTGQLRLLVLALHVLISLGLLSVLLRLTPGRAVVIGVVWQVLAGAFVLGLVFAVRLTLMEAFAVPTGAMAETILGYHKKVTCPECGYTFRVGASEEAERGLRVTGCTCPNCQLGIGLVRPELDGHQPDPKHSEVLDPGLSSGDRVVVGKGPLAGSPERLRLFAFRYPPDPSLTDVKRVVGLPGETIAIHRGDLYVLTPEKGLTFPPVEDEPPGQGAFPGGPVRQAAMHVNHPKALAHWKAGDFEIVRKSPAQVLAMMRPVYDHDHPAKDLPERWSGVDWQIDSRGFKHGGDGRTSLRYAHVLRGGKSTPVMDTLAYNSGSGMSGDNGKNWVGDLILECEAEVTKAEGVLVLELSKGKERFRARFDLASGVCTLIRQPDGQEKELASKPTPLGKPGTYRLCFANVDQRLTLWVGDDLPFGDGEAYDAPSPREPTAGDLMPAGIAASGAVTVRGLRLWRDTYYTLPEGPFAAARPEPEDVLLMYVQPGHYLMLGDNSPQSADSRVWGLVPERLLLGPVLLRYYPFDRAGRVD